MQKIHIAHSDRPIKFYNLDAIIGKKDILPQSFFERRVLAVAQELLGMYLVRRFPGGRTSASMIMETEAYDGERDLACHASKGRTARTEVMYGPAGCWYVYLCYGMHHMLNIVTGPRDYPAAVLIRAVSDFKPGPGIVTREMQITRILNGAKAARRSGLWIEDRGSGVSSKDIMRTSRIGVDYAQEWAQKPYRFILRSH